MSTTPDPRAGLAWAQDEGIFGALADLTPTWTVEPDIESISTIVRRKFNIPEVSPCVVELLAQGAFNKVYTAQCGDHSDIIVRVTLPVYPRLKTLSERATIEYIRHHTDIPAPQVFEYSAMRDDEIGFEWIIMEKVAGTKVREQWKQMSWLKKELLVRKVAAYLSQLFRKRFHRMGNIYAAEDLHQMSTKDIPDAVFLGAEHSTDTLRFCLGEVVSIPLFYNDHWTIDVLRGPYQHSRDWLAAYLRIAMHDAENMSDLDDEEDSDDSEDEDENELKETTEEDGKQDISNNSQDGKDSEMLDSDSDSDSDYDSDSNSDTSESVDPNSVEAIKSLIQRLLNVLPQVFPTGEREEYVLNHQDLSTNNMMVNEDHDFSGIIDWECVHTVPLWFACQIPRFLRGRDRPKPPPFTTDFENECYEDAYYDDLELYEKTQLRKFFLEEMERICPEWMRVHEANNIKADFAFAVDICTRRGCGASIDEWLDSVENGDEPESLRELLGQC